MKIFTCWITCLLESYQDAIVAFLVKRGYTVGLASQNDVNQNNQVSAILSFNLSKIDNPDLTSDIILDDLNIILTEMKMYFYSIIVSESTTATWSGSNIVVQSTKSTLLLPAPPNKNSKLN